MNAGPYPTKEMFERMKRGTEGSFFVEDLGAGYIGYTPMYQLSAGVSVGVDNNDGSDGAPPPTPIKTLELSWQNVQIMFEALALGTLYTEKLTIEDIEKLEIVALDGAHPAPPYTGWLPRQSWGLYVFDRTAAGLPRWQQELGNNAGGGNTAVAVSEAFRPLPLTGQTIRLTFAGQGTLKLKDGVGRPKTFSHPGVVVRALDAQGAEVSANLSVSTMCRRGRGNYGFMEPDNMPLRPQPSLIDGYGPGTEIVWPPGGAPYLHVFRSKSGGGVESYHLPLTPGLPQGGS